MGIRRVPRELIRWLVERYGYELVRPTATVPEPTDDPPLFNDQTDLPDDAIVHLRPDHPALRRLAERYAAFEPAVTDPLLWTEGHLREEDILYFRGCNAFVWQLRGTNVSVESYALTAYYVEMIDRLGLLDRLDEDRSFGNFTFVVGGRTVSRDLLDSIIEIDFLDRHLNIADGSTVRTILDIGAGYGRLAHRVLTAFDHIRQYYCVDAVAASTFVCDYYIRHRGLTERAKVVPLDEIDRCLQCAGKIDVAVNVHGFSECRIEAVDWWLSLLEKHEVEYLMVVPNATYTVSPGAGLNLSPDVIQQAVVRHGYRLLASEPKYLHPVVQEHGIEPTEHWLFQRT